MTLIIFLLSGCWVSGQKYEVRDSICPITAELRPWAVYCLPHQIIQSEQFRSVPILPKVEHGLCGLETADRSSPDMSVAPTLLDQGGRGGPMACARCGGLLVIEVSGGSSTISVKSASRK